MALGAPAMSHRTTKTLRRPVPHPFEEDPGVPGSCQRCNLPKPNEAHDEERIAELHAAQDEHRRRAGEVW
jgi:hypothetical protein